MILYIASSLDGYIADKNGSLNFLPEIPESGFDFGYKELYESIDTIIMGRSTYDYIVRSSDRKKWPYTDKKCYVYSRTEQASPKGIVFTDTSPEALLEQLWESGTQRVWLMGGGEIIREFLKKDLIDIFDIYYFPVMLGSGIPMFPSEFPRTELVLEKCIRTGDVFEVVYRRQG